MLNKPPGIHRLPLTTILALLLFCGGSLPAQPAVAITPPGEGPLRPLAIENPTSSFTRVGGAFFFSLAGPSSGNELGRWEMRGGQAPMLVRDIVPGPESSDPRNITALDGKVLFAARTPELGLEPWISDGTAEGTELIADTCPGPCSIAFGREFHVLPGGRKALFQSRAGNYFDLWVTDGTPEGTRALAAGFQPGRFCPPGSQAVFRLEEASLVAQKIPRGGGALWATDGSPEGTRLLLDDLPLKPCILAKIDGRALFSSGRRFWTTDGTLQGTRSFAAHALSQLRVAGEVGGRLVLSGAAGLWATDGSQAGTEVLLEGSAGTLRVIGESRGHLVLAFRDRQTRLYRTDGTSQGTVRMEFPEAQGPLQRVFDAAESGGELFFVGLFDQSCQLWKTNGFASGTTPLAAVPNAGVPAVLSGGVVTDDIVGCQAELFPGQPLFLLVDKRSHGELWISDGTARRTRILWETNRRLSALNRFGPHLLISDRSPSRGDLLLARGRAGRIRQMASIQAAGAPVYRDSGGSFFFARRGTEPPRLWRSNATGSGTRPASDEPVQAAADEFGDFAALGEFAFFTRPDAVVRESGATSLRHSQIWRTDGTPQGTELWLDLPGADISTLRAAAGHLFIGSTLFQRNRIWSASPAGELAEFANGRIEAMRSVPEGALMVVSQRIEEGPLEGNRISKLIATDGTATGTREIDELPTPVDDLTPTADGRIILRGLSGSQLWEYDPETGMSERLEDAGGIFKPLVSLNEEVLFFGSRHVSRIADTARGWEFLRVWSPQWRIRPSEAVLGGRLFFFALRFPDNRREELQLWATDGTPQGTKIVENFNGRRGLESIGLLPSAAGLAILLSNAEGETELRLSSGEGRSRLVRASRSLGPAAATPSLLAFADATAESGLELWGSDGTPEGTFQIQDVFPGPASSSPFGFLPLGGRLIFQAGDGRLSPRLWSLDLDSIDPPAPSGKRRVSSTTTLSLEP